jgi:1-hydroxycarotenoid 3,4-desaturase
VASAARNEECRVNTGRRTAARGRRVVVVGAGAGGLAAAVLLASRGWSVDVLEAGDRVGGKLGIGVHDGVEFDTGPTVFTLPHTLDSVLRAAGTSLEAELELLEPVPSFRYLYPDGVSLDIHPRVSETLDSVAGVLGEGAASELAGFLEYSGRIWRAAAPHFVFGPAPGPDSILRAGLALPALLRDVDPLRSMWRAIRSRVRSEHLRWLLARYATYNGSDPRRAPATLNCIAHVELAGGGYGVRGGMFEIARTLERTARSLGVRFAFGARVTAIDLAHGRVAGARLSDGTRVPADAVVANADAAHVLGSLLPPAGRRPSRGDPSMSGWVAILRARRERVTPRIAHTVLFPTRYLEEFEDIFDRGRAPREPTVYLCAQEPAHGRSGWSDDEPIFLMTNAPPESGGSERMAGETADRVSARLRAAGLAGTGDRIVWERTPCDLAMQFPGSAGAIYGASSNSAFAAFRRPPNRVGHVRGLYLASGSAHPGGGVPMCLLSGRAAASALLEDRGDAPLTRMGTK